jgi:hypothetical protein
MLATDPRAPKRIEAWWGPNLMANAERNMLDVLVAAEMPTTPFYAFDLPNDRGGRGWWCDLPHFVVTQGHGVGSKVWYAAKIIEQISDVREAMARGSHDQIIHNALHLGALMKEANIQVGYGPAIAFGVGQYEGAVKRRDIANSKRKRRAAIDHKKWKIAAAAEWERNPKLPVCRCADNVIKKLKLSARPKTVADTIRHCQT